MDSTLTPDERRQVFYKIEPEIVADVEKLIATLGLTSTVTAIGNKIKSYDYQRVAGRILIVLLMRNSPGTCQEYVEMMGTHLHRRVVAYMTEYGAELDQLVAENYRKLFKHDYFSASTMLNFHIKNLFRAAKRAENQAMMFMRIAIITHVPAEFVSEEGTPEIIETDTVKLARVWRKITKNYQDLIDRNYSPATPILLNGGTDRNTVVSCYLSTCDDTLKSIADNTANTMFISASNGANGLAISRIRHGPVHEIGSSKGIMAWMNIWNETIISVDQLGSRSGACAFYLEPWHKDVDEFIKCFAKVRPDGKRAYAARGCIWMRDLFLKRFKAGQPFSLFCPNVAKGLATSREAEFEKLYLEYEQAGKADSVVDPVRLFGAMLQSVQNTGSLHIMNADACNRKSNHRHLGYIEGSNLCTEIVEYRDPDSVACCNLSSVNLARMVSKGVINFELLARTVRHIVKNINCLIYNGNYPLEAMRQNNQDHRPMGIGVSGLAEMLKKLRLPYNSEAAKLVNKKVFACIYFNAHVQGVKLAKRHGCYKSYPGSAFSEGKLQFDLWKEELDTHGVTTNNGKVVWGYDQVTPMDPSEWGQLSFDLGDGEIIEASWDSLKKWLAKHGTMNSLYTTVQPTATTSQTTRNTESMEPSSSNLYNRQTGGGSYVVIDRYLLRDLKRVNAWNDYTKQFMLVSDGSVKHLAAFIRKHPEWYPDVNLPELESFIPIYLTAFEMSNRTYIEMCADRGIYIDQSQSFNLFLVNPTEAKMSAAIRYGMDHYLKTLVYYLRTQVTVRPLNPSVNHDIAVEVANLYGFIERAPKVEVDALPTPVTEKFIGATLSDGLSGVTKSAGDVIPDEPIMCRRDDPSCLSCS